MQFAIDQYASVKHAGVLVEFPTFVVVAHTGMLGSPYLALKQTDTAAAEVMTERMGQPDGLVLRRLPAGMEASDVIAQVAGQKTVFAALHGLLEAGAEVFPCLLALEAGGKGH